MVPTSSSHRSSTVFPVQCKFNNSNGVFNQYLSNVKSPLGNNSRAEPTTFSTEKLSCSWPIFVGKTLKSLDKALMDDFIWWGQYTMQTDIDVCFRQCQFVCLFIIICFLPDV